jgi:aspartate/methionine/tyrosine aminotransferase
MKRESLQQHAIDSVSKTKAGMDGIRSAIVVIDGSGSKDLRRQLKKYLTRRLNDDAEIQ